MKWSGSDPSKGRSSSKGGALNMVGMEKPYYEHHPEIKTNNSNKYCSALDQLNSKIDEIYQVL